jgi:hypothetical protein
MNALKRTGLRNGYAFMFVLAVVLCSAENASAATEPDLQTTQRWIVEHAPSLAAGIRSIWPAGPDDDPIHNIAVMVEDPAFEKPCRFSFKLHRVDWSTSKEFSFRYSFRFDEIRNVRVTPAHTETYGKRRDELPAHFAFQDQSGRWSETEIPLPSDEIAAKRLLNAFRREATLCYRAFPF